MPKYDEAHDREQVDAALLECIGILRRMGGGCIVCVMSHSGRVFRRISACDAKVQTELMALTARQLNANLTDLAMASAEIVDLQNPPGYLDDKGRDSEEDIGP